MRRCEVFFEFFPKAVKNIINILILLVTIVTLLFLGYLSIQYMMVFANSGRTTSGAAHFLYFQFTALYRYPASGRSSTLCW